MKKGNPILSAVFAALAVFVLITVSGYSGGSDGVPGPAMWPATIAVIMLVCALIIGINGLKSGGLKSGDGRQAGSGNSNGNGNGNTDEAGNMAAHSDSMRVYMTMACLVLYVALMYVLGFCAATVLVLTGLFHWFGKYRWWVCILVAIACTAVVYGVFHYVLKVPFRFGLLF